MKSPLFYTKWFEQFMDDSKVLVTLNEVDTWED